MSKDVCISILVSMAGLIARFEINHANLEQKRKYYIQTRKGNIMLDRHVNPETSSNTTGVAQSGSVSNIFRRMRNLSLQTIKNDTHWL